MKKNLFILFFLTILFCLLLNSGCDIFKIYKIQGIWEISKTINEVTIKMVVTFDGYKDRGNIVQGNNIIGSYSMNFEDDLVFEMFFLENDFLVKEEFSGGFDSKDITSGTFTSYSYATDETTEGGTWFAVRLKEEL